MINNGKFYLEETSSGDGHFYNQRKRQKLQQLLGPTFVNVSASFPINFAFIEDSVFNYTFFTLSCLSKP